MNNPFPFLEACLYTKDGGYVETVNLPPFQQLPDVVIWGTRIFQFKSGLDFEPKEAKENAPVYVEAFAWAVIDLEPPHGIPENAV
jgi:hypothetical protein